jgi:hypothetical protein
MDRACLRPPACPRASNLNSAPAPKFEDKGAEQQVAAETGRLTHTANPKTIRLA